MINIPIEIGDTILVGRFKNKKIVVEKIGKDENGHPTVNGKGILKVRIKKLMGNGSNIKKRKEEMRNQLLNKVQKIANEIIERN